MNIGKNIGIIIGILTIIGIITAAYYSVPTIVWVVQPNTQNQACPSIIITGQKSQVNIKNVGKIPANVEISFEGNNISFVSDNRIINNISSVGYIVQPDEITSYKFEPNFYEDIRTEVASIKLTETCQFNFLFFSIPCFNNNMQRCCKYVGIYFESKTLTNEETC